MLKAIFWLCIAPLAWAYLVYPLGMVIRSRFLARRESPPRPPVFRDVSVVLAVRDGEEWLDGRIDNLLAQEYPADRLEIIIVCNASRDRTEAMARARAAGDPRIRVLCSPAEDGKAGALNAGVGVARGDVIAFADVRQRFDADAVALLVAALETPGVGAVTGRLVISESPHPGVEGFNRYWELETLLRRAESETGSVVGATGAIYAVRKPSFRSIPPGTLLDDVYLPVRVALNGERVMMEPRAIARDVPTRSVAREYRRRVRTLAGNLQLVALVPDLMRPGNPLFMRFLSHKLLRVLSPLFFIGVMVTGLWLGGSVYIAAALAVLALYAAGIAGLFIPAGILAVPAAFVLLHAAAFSALLRRRTTDLWVR